MPEVIVDDEPVEFNGPIPEDPRVIYDLLFEALAGDRKSVIEFSVDGKSILDDPDHEFPVSFNRIDAKSISHARLTLRLINSTMEICENLVIDLDAYASRILINPWSHVFERMQDFIDKVTPLVQLMDGMSPYATNYQPVWHSDFDVIQNENKNAFENVLSSFQRGDIGGLSEVISDELIPIVEKSIAFLKGPVTADLDSHK